MLHYATINALKLGRNNAKHVCDHVLANAGQMMWTVLSCSLRKTLPRWWNVDKKKNVMFLPLTALVSDKSVQKKTCAAWRDVIQLCVTLFSAEKQSAKSKCLSRGRVAQLLEVQRLPDTNSPRRTRSSLGQIPAEPPLRFDPLKQHFAIALRNDKYTRLNPVWPCTVWSLKNRSECEVNIFQRLWSKPERQRHPSQFFQPFFFLSSRLQNRKSDTAKAVTGWWKLLWINTFVWLTVGCSWLLSLCVSLLPGLPCSAPALTVESVSPPNDVCSAQLIALCPHLQREGGRERNGAVCKLLMQKYESRANSHTSTRGVHWQYQGMGIHTTYVSVSSSMFGYFYSAP